MATNWILNTTYMNGLFMGDYGLGYELENMIGKRKMRYNFEESTELDDHYDNSLYFEFKYLGEIYSFAIDVDGEFL